MKRSIRTVKFLTFLLGLGLISAGCAVLGVNRERDPLENDPVAAAALRIANEGRAPVAQMQEDEMQYQMAHAMRARDIIRGMAMQDVLSLWGEPSEMETAGDSRMGNQKWVYYEGLSSQWSVSSARIIYFEGGRVAGWETRAAQ